MALFHAGAGPEVNGSMQYTYILTDQGTEKLVGNISEGAVTFTTTSKQPEPIGNFTYHTSHGLSITMMNCQLFNTQVDASNEFYENARGGAQWKDYLFQILGDRDGWALAGCMKTAALTRDQIEFNAYSGRSIVIANRGEQPCPSYFNEQTIGHGQTCHFVLKMVDFNHRDPDYQFINIGRSPDIKRWDSRTPIGARWAPQWVAINSSLMNLPTEARAFDIKYGSDKSRRYFGPAHYYGTCVHSPHWKLDSLNDPTITWSQSFIENDNAGAFLPSSQLVILVDVH